jgi:hypothetical protein
VYQVRIRFHRIFTSDWMTTISRSRIIITWMLFSRFAVSIQKNLTTIALPEVDNSTPYFPKTPSSLRDALFSRDTETTLALLAGGIPLTVRNRLSSLLTPCDIPGLLRLLRYTLLEHQYKTWIRRNEAQPRLDHKPSYARPKRPRPAPASREPPPRNRKHKQRSDDKIPGAGIEQLGNVCRHTGKTFLQLSHRTTTQSLAQNPTLPRTKHH